MYKLYLHLVSIFEWTYSAGLVAVELQWKK